MKWQSKTFLLFAVLAIVYAAIDLGVTPPHTGLQHYNMSSTSLRALSATVVIPVIAVWFLALYGCQKLYEYSQKLGNSEEANQVRRLTMGVMVLTYWLPVIATTAAILNLAAHNHPSLLGAATIITNYVSLLFPLVAMIFINDGARKLADIAHVRLAPRNVNLMVLALIIAGVAYGFLIASAQDNLYTIYHMPMPVVLSTLVIPYIYSWFLGLLAVFYLHAYSKTVPGIIFRKSWNMLALGLVLIIICLIALQYTTAVSGKLGDMPLGTLLLLIYGLLLLMGIGFAFLAAGAKKLKMIEEV